MCIIIINVYYNNKFTMIEQKMYTCTFFKKTYKKSNHLVIYSKILVAFNVSCSCKFIEMKFYFSISFVHFAFKYSKVFETRASN